METSYQEIADLVARKCQEVLAPLYEELHELQSHYGMREAEQPTIEPTPTPEEDEEAELEKNRQMWRKVAEEMRVKGKL